MKKRLLSMLLVLVMVLSLVACGSKEKPSTKDDDKKTEQSTEAKGEEQSDAEEESSESETEAKTEKETEATTNTDDKLAAIMTAVSEVKATGAIVEVSYAGMAAKVEIYTNENNAAKIIASLSGQNVTDIIYDGNTLYFNIKDVMAFMDAMTATTEYSTMLQQLQVTAPYLSITNEELTQLMASSGVNFELNSTESSEDDQKITDATIKFITNYSATMKGELDDSVIKYSDKYVELVIDSNNIDSIAIWAKSGDLKTHLTTYLNELKAIDSMKSNFEGVTVEDLVAEFEATLADTASFKASKGQIKAGFGVKNNNIVVDFYVSAEDETQGKQEIKFNVTTTNATQTITAPTESYKLMDLIVTIQQMQGAAQGDASATY